LIQKRHYIGLDFEAEEHAVYNPNIKTGYRIKFDSFGKVLRSLFMIHNETTNIWSHLCGFFIVLFMVVYVINSYQLIDVNSLKVEVGKKYDVIHNEFVQFEQNL
jgi:predicted membrane channel-forming protein YqfA (hemolysin III family)